MLSRTHLYVVLVLLVAGLLLWATVPQVQITRVEVHYGRIAWATILLVVGAILLLYFRHRMHAH